MAVTLETPDFNLLAQLLQDDERWQSPESRRALLRSAGLRRLIPQLNLNDGPFVTASLVVDFLARYGRISYQNEALGVFLNALKGGVGLEAQDTIDQLMQRYRMMEPIAPPKRVEAWRGTSSAGEILELVWGESTLRSVSFLHQGVRAARSVACIGVSDGAKTWGGTGFLIAPHLALTNHHVLPEAKLLGSVELRFNYEEDEFGRERPVERCAPVAGGAFHSNAALDYTVFEVPAEVGRAWGHLPLRRANVRARQPINIIQHPFGLPKQISMTNNLVEYVGGNVLQYVTSTDQGSSGSPVLDDAWQVVGLHHAGGYLREPTTGRYFGRNEGILIERILADLPAHIRAAIDQAAR